MRVGIEASTLTRPRAGIGFYTYNLLRELARLEGDEEYAMLYNRPVTGLDLPSRIRRVLNGPSSTHLWAQTRLPSICRKQGIDILHSPGQGIPLFYDGKTILTIHDLAPLIEPAHKDLVSRVIWNCFVPMMAQRANHIITVSDNSKRDVVGMLGIPEDRVTRIYEAAAPEYYPEPDEDRIERFLKDKQLEPGFILAVGTLEPRKQYPYLLELFARWLKRSKPDATLVIVGKKGWLYDEIFNTFDALNLRRNVRFESYVHDLDLMRLYYSAARFSILTPAYEGFWLPGLESLACGTPVIAPNHSSIPEIVGDAGLLMDSWDHDEWLDAMDRLWNDSDRESWVEKGVRYAQQFSWEKAARETLAVYRKVAQE